MGFYRQGPRTVRQPRHGNPLLLALRAERIRQNLTVRELAIDIGIDYGTMVTNWEMGLAKPRLENFVAWAGALGMDVVLKRRDGEAVEWPSGVPSVSP